MTKNIIINSQLTTPLGTMNVCATHNGICLVEFIDGKKHENSFSDLEILLNGKISAGENKHIIQAKKELNEYFNGQRKKFSVEIVMPGTDFQILVWKSLSDIEFGSTITYQEQADRLMKPKAVRAVASANGSNRIAIIIPCHRVIGKNGKLTGYSGGIERKRWLINHERSYLKIQ